MESSFFLSELAIAAIPSNRSDGSSILATWRVTRVRRVLVKLIFYKNNLKPAIDPNNLHDPAQYFGACWVIVKMSFSRFPGIPDSN